ncbi:hypothetical protein QAD02_020554 [Eretmocerus hayati]|uniref:Uncharacterized protein n=1 Tax=Eretmocerus hayati TaxID=131215 RepID=A0ACC2PPM6_9HYME|nr:hypothetical protein QAD02_020554 [Eretmocerus hayati]
MPRSEARRFKRKVRRNFHRARVRARKRLENRNPDTRAPVPAHPEPPVRSHREGWGATRSGFSTDWLVILHDLIYLDDPKGSGRRYLKEVWGIMNLIEEKLDVYERLLKHHLQEQEEKVARRVQRLARKQQRLQDESAAREQAASYVAMGHSQKESDLIFRWQKKEEATPSQLPPSTHPDTGSTVISSPCEQLSDIDAGIKQAEGLVDEVVKTTLNHINSLLRARTIFRIKKEIMVAMKMDVEFFKDDGPLPPGPLRRKYRAGHVRRFRRNPPPEEELLSDKTARQLASLLNGQSVVQPSSDGSVDL